MNNLLPMGAVVRRELIRSLRRPRSLGLVALVVMVAGVTALAFYPEGDAVPSEIRSASEGVYGSVIVILFASAVLLLPPVAASSLVLEREQETYELLWLTMLGPWGIAVSKTVNAVGYFLLMVCAVLPVLSVSAFLIGLDVSLMLFGIATVVAAAIASASVSVLCSANARTTLGGVTAGYGVIFFVFVGYMAPLSMLRILSSVTLPASVSWVPVLASGILMKMSPVTALATILGDPASAASNFAEPAIALAAQCIIAIVATAYAARILSRPSEKHTYLNPIGIGQMGPQPRPIRRIPGPPPLPGETGVAQPPPLPLPPTGPIVVEFEYLYEPPLPLWPPVRDGVNPMFARESIQARLNRRLTGPRATILCLVGGVMFGGAAATVNSMVSGDRYEMLIGTWMGVGALFATIIAPLAASSCWARERELETFDMLRMTMLTPRQIVTGKFLAALRAAQQFYALYFVFSFPALIGLLGGFASIGLLATGLVTIGATAIECVALCVLAGLNGYRTPAAIVWGVVLLSALLALPALALPVLLARFDPNLWLILVASTTSPAMAYDVLILYWSTYPFYTISAWGASCLFHTAIGFALLHWATRRYENDHARAA